MNDTQAVEVLDREFTEKAKIIDMLIHSENVDENVLEELKRDRAEALLLASRAHQIASKKDN